ncbi:MAG TPA: threonine-phosphate decarboxylase [Candidatus Binataceae bacterium]
MKTPPGQIAIDRAHGGCASEGCIDFSTSLNPLGPPAEAIQAYHEAAACISKYPPAYPRRLEARIAAWLGADPETVIAANGSTQLIYLAARVLGLKSPFVVIPTFSEIANALVAAGSHPSPISTKPEDDFRFEHGALRDALETGADGVFLGRPNSPTGTLIGLDETTAVVRECDRRGAWCVVDEAFIEFADNPRSACTLLGSFKRLIVLRSLTKVFAIPGLRLGYLLGSPDFVSKLCERIEPWSVNAIAEYVALACLDVADRFIPATRHTMAEERRRLERGLGSLRGLKVFPSSANFMMLAVRSEQSCGEFGRYTLNGGIAIRDLSGLPGCSPGLYRIGVRSRTDNQRLLAATGAYFGSRS